MKRKTKLLIKINIPFSNQIFWPKSVLCYSPTLYTHYSGVLVHMFPLWTAFWHLKKNNLTEEPLLHGVTRMTIHICCVRPAVGLNGSVWLPLPPCKHIQSCKHQISRTHVPTHPFTRSRSASGLHTVKSDGKKQGSKTLLAQATAQMTAAGFFPPWFSVFIHAREALPHEWQWLLPLISVLMRRWRNRETAAQLSVNDPSVWHDHTPAGWQLMAAATEGRAC